MNRLQSACSPPVPWLKERTTLQSLRSGSPSPQTCRASDFEFHNGEVTRPYQRCLGKTFMRTTDWTYYHAQDEANPTEYHPDWPTRMREMGLVLVLAGSEPSPNKMRIPPLSPTYLERTLWRKIADLKQPPGAAGNSPTHADY